MEFPIVPTAATPSVQAAGAQAQTAMAAAAGLGQSGTILTSGQGAAAPVMMTLYEMECRSVWQMAAIVYFWNATAEMYQLLRPAISNAEMRAGQAQVAFNSADYQAYQSGGDPSRSSRVRSGE